MGNNEASDTNTKNILSEQDSGLDCFIPETKVGWPCKERILKSSHLVDEITNPKIELIISNAEKIGKPDEKPISENPIKKHQHIQLDPKNI